MDETELIRRTAHGDRAAFDSLYALRQPALYRYALAMSSDAAVAEETVHDVFLALIRRTARFDATRGSAQSFLFGVARNLVREKLRARGRTATSDEDLLDLPSPEPSLPDRLDADATRQRLHEAVAKLPLNYREALVLCDLQQMSYADAAERAGLAVGTIRSRLHRARALLRRRLTTAQPALAGGKRNP